MGLSKAIEGSNHTGQRITWLDELGNIVDLTGSEIKGKKRLLDGTEVTDIEGSLDLVAAEEGIFDWKYGTSDIAAKGEYLVQFIATYLDETKEKNFIIEFIVEDALDV